ncbi:MAG: hypothetical protein RR494_06205 [Vagococcus sp.]|uniref:hypothetical protein n=1 Tax=Vagococcus TaxID=2737 RepID=UPI002FCB17DF
MEIIQTRLQTNYLKENLHFYETVLGFQIENQTETSFEVIVGISKLIFEASELAEAPYYHFAFDIPTGRLLEAKQWLSKRVTLSLEDGKDQITFGNSGCTSVYFEDASGNIVELIERSKTSPELEGVFDSSSVLKLSEMSLVVPNKLEVAEQLIQSGLQSMFNSDITEDGLSFMTDTENKVFVLLVNLERKWLFSEKKSKPFKQEILLDSGIILGMDDNNHFYIH